MSIIRKGGQKTNYIYYILFLFSIGTSEKCILLRCPCHLLLHRTMRTFQSNLACRFGIIAFLRGSETTFNLIALFHILHRL